MADNLSPLVNLDLINQIYKTISAQITERVYDPEYYSEAKLGSDGHRYKSAYLGTLNVNNGATVNKLNELILTSKLTGFEISGGTTAKKITVGGNTSITGDLTVSAATNVMKSLTVGAAATYTGAVTIRSKGTNPTTITGPDNGEAKLINGIYTTSATTENDTTPTENELLKIKKISAKTFLAGPETGSNAVPTYRGIKAADLPEAGEKASGIVTTGAQTFAGAKTFSNTIIGSINGNAATATTADKTAHGISVKDAAKNSAVNGWNGSADKTLTITGTSPVSTTATDGAVTITHDDSGVAADTYRSVTVDAKGHVTAGTNPTTLEGYGITDANIKNGVITLGSNTITPLTASSTLAANKVSGTLAADNIPKLDASKIDSGTIAIERLPATALERCVVVANDTARFALSESSVQVGDTVKVTATKKMYMVIDSSKLSSEAGYEEYFTSTDWSTITNKPSSYTPATHPHAAATQSANGFMSATDKTKLDGITESADSVSFTRSLTSGTKVGTITINGTGTDLYAPTNTDTHYTAENVVASSSTGTANVTAATSDPYLNLIENGAVRSTHRISGSGATSVKTDTSGNITISSTNTTYEVATTSSNGLMSSADKTKLDGIAPCAEVNQNAFSNVAVGSTTISADSKTDTLTLAAGDNITLTPDATNDKITISSSYVAASASASGIVTTKDQIFEGAKTFNDKTDSNAELTAGAVIIMGGLSVAKNIYAAAVHNAVWNDLVDCMEVPENTSLEFGYCYSWEGDSVIKSSHSSKNCIGIHSNTAGFAMGEKKTKTIRAAVAGFVLAYTDKLYPEGTPLTWGDDGVLTKCGPLKRILHPERVIATFYREEKEEKWHNLPVLGRHWVKIV